MNKHSAPETLGDLTTCDREPIHALGRVQSFGFLLGFDRNWTVAAASDNLGAFAHLQPDEALGRHASDVLAAPALGLVRARLEWMRLSGVTERVFAENLFGDGRLFDLAVHDNGQLLILEAEPAGNDSDGNAVSTVRTMLTQARRARSTDDFLKDAARNVRALTGFDRVMVYRFLDDDSGVVTAESRSKGMESYYGLRYPASDIPKQARALYCKNMFRIIADVDDAGAGIIVAKGAAAEPVDLSLSVLRSVSPIHVEYLKNMGVASSLSISIVIDGKLWGLFACHHRTARSLSFDTRTAAELFAELFSLELANRNRQAMVDDEVRSRAIHDRIMTMVAGAEEPFVTLRENLDMLASIIEADGVCLCLGGVISRQGATPSDGCLDALTKILNERPDSKVFATDHLSGVLGAKVCEKEPGGVLAIPLSRIPKDYILFFRNELLQVVNWAGNPQKPVEWVGGVERVSPRKSFAAWQEVVAGRSAPWTASDVRIAEALRATFLEVVVRSIDRTFAEKRKAQETQDLLIGELNHRVRNILTLIHGIVRSTKASVASVSEFSDVVGGRIHALARAHDQLTEQNWKTAPLRRLLMNEVEAFGGTSSGRVTLSGPGVSLSATAYTCVALVMHEMVTNAVKYGALSVPTGQLKIVWSVDPQGALAIKWEELGGPAVQAPTRTGFGSSIVERA
ncbi:MAG: HWE histidine kinase domain-containing protein, partial [Pseudomonadota bacterium]